MNCSSGTPESEEPPEPDCEETGAEPLAPPVELNIEGAVPFNIGAHISLNGRFAVLDWHAANAWLDGISSPDVKAEARTACARAWLLHLCASLGPEYRLSESGTALLVSSLDDDLARATLDYMALTVRRVLAILDGVAVRPASANDILIVLDDYGTYYDYVAQYFPEGGEYGASQGVFVRSGCCHFATVKGKLHRIEPTIVHEMTHEFLSHLPLPNWLNEGIAVNTTARIAGRCSLPGLSDDERQEQLDFWSEAGMQNFWLGRSFFMPGDEAHLSYDLAELMVVDLAEDWPRFIRFVRAADRKDAGAAAAHEHLGIDLGAFLGRILGKESPAWSPCPASWELDESHWAHTKPHRAKPKPIGPFARPVNQPIIRPDNRLVFPCPMSGTIVRWAENHVFNPAAIVYDDRVHLFFRAEDGSGDNIGTYTSRIGHATSSDGVSFQIEDQPVVYPANDAWKGYEWRGGCEDPRVVQRGDGLFVMHYTMWNRGNPSHVSVTPRLGVCSSTDLKHWTKHGPAFAGSPDILDQPHKSAGVVQEIQDGVLVAAKINGVYWMYWGEEAIHLATSPDLIQWQPVHDSAGKLRTVIAPNPGHFDSALTEVGPPAIRTDNGIILVYNGKNATTADADTTMTPGVYTPGQLLLDPDEPGTVLDRPATPFMLPECYFERTGQYQQGTIFACGLVLFNLTWHLYYGASDTFVCVATAPYAL